MDVRVGLWRNWAPKNWRFWTAVLVKTLESPLDCKEIQPVHSKGDQPQVFFGRNDAKAETPVLWPPHAKSWLIGKGPDAGRDWGQEEKGMTEDETARWHHWLDGHEFEWTTRMVMDREAWRAVIHGVAKIRTQLSDWTEVNNLKMDWCNTLYLNYVLIISSNFADFSVLLFAPYICNFVARFVSSHRKAFKIQRWFRLLGVPQSPSTITWTPGSETLNMRVRICCLKNLRMMPLNQLRRNYGMIMLPLFHGNIILLKEKRGMRVVTASVGRSHVPKQQEKIYCKWHFFFLLCWLNRFCLRLTFFFYFFSFLKLWVDNSSTNQCSCQLFYEQSGHTLCHSISKMHIVGEGSGETPSALRYLSYLISSSLTDIKCLSKN